MAKEYKFQYELVTYKWPTWLRAQKEKQRVIWAYKILFLDVLFPMNLKKVIFVDADQIVRADLQELVDLDLHGAPYGYTPMGDDNPDMEGFRFWKTGYWKDYLRGRPYHIRQGCHTMPLKYPPLMYEPFSALYVIDLVRFRQLAAGVSTTSLVIFVCTDVFLGSFARSLSAAFGGSKLSCQFRSRYSLIHPGFPN